MLRGVYSVVGALCLVAAATGCHAAIGDAPRGVDGTDGSLGNDGGGGIDALVGVDGSTIDAALGMFSTPTPVTTAATAKGEDDPVLSSDALELIFAIDDTATTKTSKDLFIATRAATTADFGTPTAITNLNTVNAEESPRLSADDLTLFYASGGVEMQATRTAIGQPFGTPTAVSFLTTTVSEKWFDSCSTGYYLVARNTPANGFDFFEGTVGAEPTRNVAELNSPENEISTFLSPDCLTVYFASNRPVGAVTTDVQIYQATRATATAVWNAPTPVTTFGLSTDDEDLYITPNGRTAVLASTRGDTNSKDIFISTR